MEKTAIVTSDTARLMRNALRSPEDLSKRRNYDYIKYFSGHIAPLYGTDVDNELF
jgi:hypothetical protein